MGTLTRYRVGRVGRVRCPNVGPHVAQAALFGEKESRETDCRRVVAVSHALPFAELRKPRIRGIVGGQ